MEEIPKVQRDEFLRSIFAAWPDAKGNADATVKLYAAYFGVTGTKIKAKTV